MTSPIDGLADLSDADVERISEEANEAAIHASSFAYSAVGNPYPPTSASAVLFTHCFRQHYARINGK